MDQQSSNTTAAPSATSGEYVAPSIFSKAKGIKYEVGKSYDLTKMGLGAHWQYGPIPEFTVTMVKADGSFLEGTMKCQSIPGEPSCDETVHVSAGDLFQKRRCGAHQRRFARRKARPGLDPAEKVKREAARESAKVDRLAKKEREKAQRKAEHETKDKERIAQRIKELDAKKQQLDAVSANAELQQDPKAHAAG